MQTKFYTTNEVPILLYGSELLILMKKDIMNILSKQMTILQSVKGYPVR